MSPRGPGRRCADPWERAVTVGTEASLSPGGRWPRVPCPPLGRKLLLPSGSWGQPRPGQRRLRPRMESVSVISTALSGTLMIAVLGNPWSQAVRQEEAPRPQRWWDESQLSDSAWQSGVAAGLVFGLARHGDTLLS